MSSWVETGAEWGGTNSASAGQIWIDDGTNELRLRDDDNERAGYAMATITLGNRGPCWPVDRHTKSYDFNENGFDAGETVTGGGASAADGVTDNFYNLRMIML